MKKTTAAAYLAVALVVAAATASHGEEAVNHAAEGVKQGAVEAMEKANSWVGWVYQKLTQNIGNEANQDNDAAQGAMAYEEEKANKNNVKENIGIASGESYNDMSQQPKENYELAKEKASHATGDIGEKMRNSNSEL